MPTQKSDTTSQFFRMDFYWNDKKGVFLAYKRSSWHISNNASYERL